MWSEPRWENLDESELRDLRQVRRQALEDRLDTSDGVRLPDALVVEEIVFGQGLSSRNPHTSPNVQHQAPIILAVAWLSRHVEAKRNRLRETLDEIFERLDREIEDYKGGDNGGDINRRRWPSTRPAGSHSSPVNA